MVFSISFFLLMFILIAYMHTNEIYSSTSYLLRSIIKKKETFAHVDPVKSKLQIFYKEKINSNLPMKLIKTDTNIISKLEYSYIIYIRIFV